MNRWVGTPHGRQIPGNTRYTGAGPIIGSSADQTQHLDRGPLLPVLQFQSPVGGYPVDGTSFSRVVVLPVQGYRCFSLTATGVPRMQTLNDNLSNAGFIMVPIRFRV